MARLKSILISDASCFDFVLAALEVVDTFSQKPSAIVLINDADMEFLLPLQSSFQAKL